MKWLKTIAAALMWLTFLVAMSTMAGIIISDYKQLEIENRKLQTTKEVCPTCKGRGIVYKKTEK